MKIEELKLSLRTYNSLKRAGIDTVAQLRAMDSRDLLKIRNLGVKCLFEIQEKVGIRVGAEELDTEVEACGGNVKTAFLNGAEAMRQRILGELRLQEEVTPGIRRADLVAAQRMIRELPFPALPVLVISEGFQAFRGAMLVVPRNPDRDPERIWGDWLYKPDTDCWYCRGRSYPAEICRVLGV